MSLVRFLAPASAVLALVIGCSSDVADTTSDGHLPRLGTTRQAVVTTFGQGTLILPMGNNHQNNAMTRANGLAYHLLRNNIPLQWAVLPGKAQDGNDFTIPAGATVVNRRTTTNIAAPVNYRGGGFIIAAANAAAALPFITAWMTADGITNVHELTSNTTFQADIVKTLTAAPSIAVFEDGFEDVAYTNLNAAGILDSANNVWSLTSPGSLAPALIAGTAPNNADGALFDGGFPAYAFLTSEHYDTPDPEIVAEVRSWLDAGIYTHAFMQCAAATSFENLAPGGGNPGGRFLTTAGLINTGGRPTPLTTRLPADPIAQFDGPIDSDTGTTATMSLAAGSVFRANSRTLINESDEPVTQEIMFVTGVLDGDATNGRVTYLAGHNYSTTLPVTANALTNGTRLFYNAIFDSPSALATGQPNFTITKTAPAITNQGTITFTINYANAGAAPSRNVVITDTVPAGTTFASAANGGTLAGGVVTWNIGTVGPTPANGSVSFTVNVAADATITNRATISYNAWQTRRSVQSNQTSTIRDATPPDTTIESGPNGPTSTNTATFDFSSNENGVTYECSLDGGAFTACTDPSTFSNLGVGPHTLSVRAKDAAGNVDPTPATRAWSVTAPGGDASTIDSDGDGLTDDLEIQFGTNPNDADSDDDGVPDGLEPDWNKDTDGDGLINALDPDSDNDGLFDGTEMGLGCSNPATDLSKKHCVADGDNGLTKTNPLKRDTDDGGVSDGSEDANLNGVIDPGETDPTAGHGADDNTNKDTDGDGLSDALEATLGSNPNDADSDDDGVRDGDEPNPADDTDGDGKRNIVDADSDGDGLFDGTEMGKNCADPATDASKGTCVADADNGATKTSPLDPDTDRGGVRDGDEDTNKNGRIDPGERDPNNKADDNPGCTTDSQCGTPTSGIVCVDAKCVPGCRGQGGNGCGAGEVCTSSNNLVGICAPAGNDGGVVDPPNRLEGGGIDCAASPGSSSTTSSNSGSTLAIATLIAIALTGRRKKERR